MVFGATVETALNELAAGKTQAAVVGASGLEFYKDLSPGRFAKLRVLTQSEIFPPLVIAYCQGGLDDATLGKIRGALRGPQDRDGPRHAEHVEPHVVRPGARKLC